jgi:polyphosphate kinase
MPRNLDARVELLASVEAPELRAGLEDALECCLADDTFGWELEQGGGWKRRTGGRRSVHRELMERATARASAEDCQPAVVMPRKAGERPIGPDSGN